MISKDYKLGFVPAFRQKDAKYISPSVVHWKQNHYAAIIEERNGRYLLEDPTFRSRIWVTEAALEEEASGYCLIPESAVDGGWRPVNEDESSRVFGKGYPQAMDDSDPSPCVECCEPGSGGEGTGSGEVECGMATWQVVEPNINLEIIDTPMMYRAAYGPDFVLKLKWRQRSIVPLEERSHFEGGWHSDLLSFIDAEDVIGGNDFQLYWGDGSKMWFNFSNGSYSDTNFVTGMWATRVLDGNGATTQIDMHSRNGSKETYEIVPGGLNLRLKHRRDATGEALTFSYNAAPGSDLTNRLSTVVTADDAAFTFHYDHEETNAYRITRVTGPNNREVTFSYIDVYRGPLLGSIEDAVGLTSSFTYGLNNWIDGMTTPYGTTSFDIFDAGGNDLISNLSSVGVDRSIIVTEPGNERQVYLFYDNGQYNGAPDEMAGKIPTAFNTNQVPTYLANDPPLQALDIQRNTRNSHYWNRQQASQLTNDPSLFTAADYRVSRTRHWLISPQSPGSVRSLAWELPPSHDAQNEVQPTFFDYFGKLVWGGTGNHNQGTNSLPNVISRKMPDGTTWYQFIERNHRGMKTNVVERWVENGTTLFRTNTFKYASGTGNATIDGLLLVEHRGPGGQLIAGYALDSTYPDQYGKMTNAVSEVTTYTYDADRRLLTKLDHAGLLSTHQYDGVSGRLTNVVESISGTPVRTNKYQWNAGYLWKHTDARGMQRTFGYDLLGRMTNVTYPDFTTEMIAYSLPANTGFNTSTSALPILDPVSYTDRLNHTWFMLPNRLRQIQTVIEPARAQGQPAVTNVYDYCGCGSPTSIIRAAGTSAAETTSVSYNYQGRPISMTFPDTTLVTNGFDKLGRLQVQVDHYSSVTHAYDNLSRLVERSNGAGLIEGRGYDDHNRLLRITNSSGVLITNAFDGLNRLTKRGYPNGALEQWGYTPGYERPTSFVNGENDTTTWVFDRLQRLKSEAVAGVYTNSFNYDGADLRELVDGKGQVTKWAYDQFGQMTNKIDAANVVIITNAWDADGRMTKRWTKQKGLTQFAYDAVGNLTNVNYPADSDLQFAYNEHSRLIRDARSGVITNVYTHKPGGLLESEETPQWASSKVTLGHTSFLRTSLALQQPGASDWTNTYAYDNARRLDQITGSSGTFDYSYASVAGVTASRLVNKITVPTVSAAAYITNVFDTLARMTKTSLRKGSTILNEHDYLLNQAHQPTKQTRADGSYIDYVHDDAGQLVSAKAKESASNGGAPRAHEQFGYRYDAAGNLNVRTNNAFQQTFTPDTRNQLTSISRTGTYTVGGGTVGNASSVTVADTGNGATVATLYTDRSFARAGVTLLNGNNTFTAIAQDSSGRKATNTASTYLPAAVALTHDDNGNMESDGQSTYSYDDENQLITIERPNDRRSEFTYDARMRRRIATESAWNGVMWVATSVVQYVYDGNVVLQERHFHPSTGEIVKRVTYTRGLDLSGGLQKAGGIGGLLARSETEAAGDSHAIFHADRGGNITAMLNRNDIVVARYLYDPFGRTIAQSGPLAEANTLRFSSKDHHIESGLYYYGYRFYSPELQRWLNRDPIQENGGVNLYVFVRNSPVGSIDRFGHCPLAPALPALVAGLAEATATAAATEALAVAAVGTYSYVAAALGSRSGRGTPGGMALEGLSRRNAPPALVFPSVTLPFTGKPGAVGASDRLDGKPKQARRYGEDGFPETDVDYDHDHGQGTPHAHDWGRPTDGGAPTKEDRSPGRPVKPSDPQHPNAPSTSGSGGGGGKCPS